MHIKEYIKSNHKGPYHHKALKMLNQWKALNGIEERCVIHHRDDTEETRKYNEEHYELWGFNEDGTFEYGKYVVFMTHAEHSSYHNKGHNRCQGENNPMYGTHRCGGANPFYGKSHSDETKQRLSEYFTGRHLPDETKQRISDSVKGERHPMYGKKHSETSINKNRESNIKTSNAIKYLYNTYKTNGGVLSWNGSRTALKNGDITFEIQSISVYMGGGNR